MLLVAAGGASANCIGDTTGTVFGCGATVTESCTFNADMTCAAGDGLTVGAAGITINGYNATLGQFFKIMNGTVVAGEAGIRNSAGHADVTIKNLEITNFGTGISISADSNTVDNCTIHDNGVANSGSTYGIDVSGNHNTITGCRIYNTAGYSNYASVFGGSGVGISDSAEVGLNTITGNDIYGNDEFGVVIRPTSPHNVISYNHITGNKVGIIAVAACTFNTTVECNNASVNGVGICMAYAGSNYIANNTANNSDDIGLIAGHPSGAGISLILGASDNMLFNNTLCHNDNYGIYDASGGNEFYNNTACFNPIDIWDGGSTGDNNTCSTTYNYDDTGTTGCTFPCPCWGADLVVTNKTERWNVTGVDYYVNYTVCNIGTANSNESFTTIYINGVSNGTDTLPALGIDECYTNASWGPFPSYGCDEIRLWADSTNTTSECDEGNNNLTNKFGRPDLVIDITNFTWADPSWKTFTVNYTVTNQGTLATTTQCWVNFTCPDWPGQNCIDSVPVPPLAANGDNYSRVGAGPFTINGTFNPVTAYVDWNDTIIDECDETNNDDLRCTFTLDPKPGCAAGQCWNATNHSFACGDANLDGNVNMGGDVDLLFRHVHYPPGNPIDCLWDADVDGNTVVNMGGDVDLLFRHVHYPPGNPLNCRKGCYP